MHLQIFLGQINFSKYFTQERSTKSIQLLSMLCPHWEKTKKMKSGGKVSSASKRADGIAQKGKTKGKYL